MMPPDPHGRAIMIVDDDPEAIELLQRLLAKIHAVPPITFAAVEPAIDFLSSAGHAASALPLIAFVDVKMPQMSGLDLLDWIREHAVFEVMPVVMVSSSDDPRDVQQAFALRAQGYFLKYPSLETLREVLRRAADAADGATVEAVFRVTGNLLLGKSALDGGSTADPGA